MALPRYPVRSTPDSGDAPNLQLAFWRRCIAEFEGLRDLASSDGGYPARAFAERAAIAVVLAGTGMAQLLGQNDPDYPRRADRDHVAQPDKIAASLGVADDDFAEFIRVYNDLRHFGPPRFADPDAIGVRLLEQDAPALILRILRASHGAWCRIVGRGGNEPSDDVTDYKFEWKS